MPYAYSTFTLPCGTAAIRADGTGVITRENAEGLRRNTTLGGQYSGMPLLVDNRQMAKMEPEARSLFALGYDPNIDHPCTAIVVTDSVLRVTVSFLLRTAKTTTWTAAGHRAACLLTTMGA